MLWYASPDPKKKILIRWQLGREFHVSQHYMLLFWLQTSFFMEDGVPLELRHQSQKYGNAQQSSAPPPYKDHLMGFISISNTMFNCRFRVQVLRALIWHLSGISSILAALYTTFWPTSTSKSLGLHKWSRMLFGFIVLYFCMKMLFCLLKILTGGTC